MAFSSSVVFSLRSPSKYPSTSSALTSVPMNLVLTRGQLSISGAPNASASVGWTGRPAASEWVATCTPCLGYTRYVSRSLTCWPARARALLCARVCERESSSTLKLPQWLAIVPSIRGTAMERHAFPLATDPIH